MSSRAGSKSLDLPALIAWIFPAVNQSISIIVYFGFRQNPYCPNASLRPVRQPKKSAGPSAAAQDSFPVSVVADSPRSPSLLPRLNSLSSATAGLESSAIVFGSISPCCPAPNRIIFQGHRGRIKTRPRVLSGHPADGKHRARMGWNRRRNPTCSLPRTHPGHRQKYGQTHGPWIAVSAVRVVPGNGR